MIVPRQAKTIDCEVIAGVVRDAAEVFFQVEDQLTVLVSRSLVCVRRSRIHVVGLNVVMESGDCFLICPTCSCVWN
jgi:hypothetical protein